MTEHQLKTWPEFFQAMPMTGEQKRLAYEESRRQWREEHPTIESSAPFIITPELEKERADRIDKRQWKEPAHTLTAADIEILQLKGAI